MMTPVYFLSLLEDTPKKDFWDYGILIDILGEKQAYEVDQLFETDVAIIIIPARSHAAHVEAINHELSKIKGAVLFLMGDEQNVFPVEKINHPNIRIWVQNPRMGRHDNYRKLGTGYPPQIKYYTELKETKEYNWFFAGQMTHERRMQMWEASKNIPMGYALATEGFTQGVSQEEYYKAMADSKICLCPSGPETVDTFRLFEALEMGCVPIVDTKTPKEDMLGFWEWLFGEPVPFVQIKEWSDVTGYIEDCLSQYPHLNNTIHSWWIRQKNKMRRQLQHDINEVGALESVEDITVVVPISPIPSNPDIRIVEETLRSIRFHLPNAQIILTFDGVREEQKHMKEAYQEHIRRVLWHVKGWGNVTPYIFDGHTHQVGMMKAIIEIINTPMLLYVEHDTPLVIDEPIDWNLLKKNIVSGNSNLIRLHFEGTIPQEHKHLMIGEPEKKLLKTVQWSQRPHIASTAFYHKILHTCFSAEANCFVEDVMHGKVMEDYNQYGVQGWNQWRIHIYYPHSENIKRSYNLDGRERVSKFDTTQKW